MSLIVQNQKPFTPNFSDKEEQVQRQCPFTIGREIVQQPFSNLQTVFLQFQQFVNTGNISFQGHLTLQIDNEFVNQIGKLFSATHGLTIAAGSIENKGVINAPQGAFSLTAPRVDNRGGALQGCSGKISADSFSNYQGKVIIANRAEIAVYGQVDNQKGSIFSTGTLNLEGGAWNNTDGEISGKKGVLASIDKLLNSGRGKIGSSQGFVDVVTVNDLEQYSLIEAKEGIALESKAGKILSSGSKLLAPDKKILIQTGPLSDEADGIVDEGSEWTGGIIEVRSPHHLISLVQTQVNTGLLVVSGNQVHMLEFIQQPQSEDCLDSELLVEADEEISIENSDILAEVRLESDGDIVITNLQVDTQGDIHILGDTAKLTDVQLVSKGPQHVEVADADFFHVYQRSSDGELSFKMEELGTFEECTFLSDNKTITHSSTGDLSILKTRSVAKQQITQESANFIADDSYFVTPGPLHINASKINSERSTLYSDTLSVQAEQVNSDALSAFTTHDLTIAIQEEAQLLKGSFHSTHGKLAISSSAHKLDLSGSKTSDRICP